MRFVLKSGNSLNPVFKYALLVRQWSFSLSSHIPREFARKPCSLSDVIRWKATELRQFLLYIGPVVLRGVLPEPLYENFILPHLRGTSTGNWCLITVSRIREASYTKDSAVINCMAVVSERWRVTAARTPAADAVISVSAVSRALPGLSQRSSHSESTHASACDCSLWVDFLGVVLYKKYLKFGNYSNCTIT